MIEDCNLSIAIDHWLIIDYRKDLSLLSGIEENDFRSFSEEARRGAGFQLDAAQCGWTQQEVAEKLSIGQSCVSDLMRGKWDKFSLDMLIPAPGSMWSWLLGNLDNHFYKRLFVM